jgi:diguanylate cyclase
MQTPSCLQLDAADDAKKWHEKALQLLHQHQIPPAPVCHFIAYQYASGRNDALNQRIDQQLKNKSTLDDRLFRHLFEEFCLQDQDTKQIDSHLSDLHNLLYQVLQGVTSACSHTELFDETLRQQTIALRGEPRLEDLRTIAGTLLDATTRSIQHNRAMQDQLQSVEQQTQNLQNEVKKLRDEATTDPLTGLYNRRALNRHIQSLLASAEELQATPFSVLMLDIDHFKQFNDQFGHILGDEVIRRVAMALKELLRENDFPARYGGEEFTVVLPSTDIDNAVQIAHAIHQAVGRLTLIRRSTQEHLPGITISVGAATIRRGDSCETLLDRADQALYLAKEGGRNRITSEAEISYM